ncbi:heterokaryon incompatibility protein-domain-containing protein [Halenospora varia]|nr:heterokaryon incompatibility protein-domain-containing protein [Halenospora varia]
MLSLYFEAWLVTHVSLDDKPDYVALSYTWGDPQDTEIITVEQSLVSVTRNLHSALEHLRYDNTDRVFWIDALCINQSDNEEKGWQVQLMREIYQRATSVSIWLGPADATSDKVVDFLNVLGTKAMSFGLDQGPNIIRCVSEQWRKLASHPLSFRDRSRQRVTVEDGNTGARVNFLMGDLNELYYSISGSHEQDRLFPVEGMASLFKRAWWGRIWVLQELSLAQKAGFVCGMKRLSRRRCTAALNAFKALGLVFQEMHILKGVMGTAYQSSVAMADFDWRPTVLLSMWNTHRRSPYPLLALLRATCIAGLYSQLKNITLEATDPRDKIYGLFGLAADRDRLKELGFLPDYTRSCQDVYISIAVAILRQGHLSALSLGQFSKAQTGLPSWVPDWSKPLGDTLQGVGTDHMTPDPEYNASGSLLQTEPIFSGIGATTSISVSGFAYDEVRDLGATWKDLCSLEYTTYPFVPAKKLLEELVRLSFLRDKIFKDLKERICAAARTVTAEIGYNDNGRWARIGNQRYHTAVSLMMIPVNGPCEMNLPNSGFLELIKSDGIQPGIDMISARKYCGEIAAKAHRRKPFVTAKGYLGLGPDHIKPGDVIAILIGSQVPFVLRKSVDRKYEIVGEAYVDGIMDGEAVARRESVGALELI